MSNFNCGPDPDHWEVVTDPERVITIERHLSSFHQIQEYMIDQARLKSNLGLSYRNFLVGGAAFAFNRYAPRGEQWKIFYGANAKVNPQAPKECGERNAVNAARCVGYTDIIGIVVVGVPQPNEAGITHPTLRPCHICMETFSLLPEIKEWTEIVTAHLEEDGIRERFTFTELKQEFEQRR